MIIKLIIICYNAIEMKKRKRPFEDVPMLQQNLFISLGNIFYGMGRGFCGTWWKIRSVMIFFGSPPFFMKHIIFRPPPPAPPVLIKITGGVLYIYPLILRYVHSNINIYIYFFFYGWIIEHSHRFWNPSPLHLINYYL